jgi:hypothetical protein
MKIRRAREFTNTFALQYLVSDQQHAWASAMSQV